MKKENTVVGKPNLDDQYIEEFKQLVIREWLEAHPKKYAALSASGRLDSEAQVKAAIMVDELKHVRSTNKVDSTEIVKSKHVPACFHVERITRLREYSNSIIDTWVLRISRSRTIEDLQKEPLVNEILEHANGFVKRAIQGQRLETISEYEGFVHFYLSLKVLLETNSKSIDPTAWLLVNSHGGSSVLRFEKCFEFFVQLDMAIQEEIVDFETLDDHKFEVFLRKYFSAVRDSVQQGIDDDKTEKKPWTGTQVDLAVKYERERLTGEHKDYSRRHVFQIALKEYEIRDSAGNIITEWRKLSKALSNYNRCNPPIEEEST